jgi:hypothetical protein
MEEGSVGGVEDWSVEGLEPILQLLIHSCR